MTLLIVLSLAALGAAQQETAPGERGLRDKMACGPISIAAPPIGGIRVTTGAVPGRVMFGPGDGFIVNAGTKQGIRNGQMYYVRRYVKDAFTPAALDFTPISIHTAGWVTIVDAREETSVGTVTHACDGILEGDYLEPYTEPVVPIAALGGAPDYEHPARIVMADEKRQTASPGEMVLINRGSDHDVRAGQSLTIFRTTLNGAGPLMQLGRATVVSVRPQTSMIRIDAAREGIFIGDLAAIHRITQ